MEQMFSKRHYRIDRSQIAYLRFILESYDGLAFMSTLDNREALIEISYPPSRQADAEALLSALAAEVAMTQVSAPDLHR
ncbi:hypothetical protein DESUT3_34110 [Desulfuromonas versatilis]|uniref:DUF4911 domain-containing protein n=1 Tax=Desulfuromonas versatilis TaxID=2802975 RepID=A0ABM8HTR5_9BACT|nr:DUF4911 domain-containing protein [Desulfuromonas versatilis]BCR06342.1 hypothetical protein DESUT3_34110 [Desulfuromonas versatilis]